MRKPIAFFVILLATVSATPAPGLLLNLSTRVEIPPPALGEDVTSLIGGFIIGGNSGRKMLVRALGPSLADFGLIPLADPTLELHARILVPLRHTEEVPSKAQKLHL